MAPGQQPQASDTGSLSTESSNGELGAPFDGNFHVVRSIRQITDREMSDLCYKVHLLQISQTPSQISKSIQVGWNC